MKIKCKEYVFKSCWNFWNNKNGFGPITFMAFSPDITDSFLGAWERQKSKQLYYAKCYTRDLYQVIQKQGRQNLGRFESEWREKKTPLRCLAEWIVVRKRREEETSVGTRYKLFCELFAFEESALSLWCDKWARQIKVSWFLGHLSPVLRLSDLAVK